MWDVGRMGKRSLQEDFPEEEGIYFWRAYKCQVRRPQRDLLEEAPGARQRTLTRRGLRGLGLRKVSDLEQNLEIQTVDFKFDQ